MTSVGPMTVIVACILLICLVAGLVFLVRAMSARTLGRKRVCGRCRNVNPWCAKYCAHCGQVLESS